MHICSGLPYILPAYSCVFTVFIQYFMHSIPCFSIPSCITIRKTPLLRILAAVAVRRFCGHNAQHSRTVSAVSAVLWAVTGWGCTLKRDQYSLSGAHLVPICGLSGFCLQSCATSSAVHVIACSVLCVLLSVSLYCVLSPLPSLSSLFTASVIVFPFSLCVAWFFAVVLLCASLFPVSCCFVCLCKVFLH